TICSCRPPTKPLSRATAASRSPSGSGGADPPQRQDSHVVRLLGAADKAADIVDYRRNDVLSIDRCCRRQRLGQPLGGIKLVLGVLRFRDPVGKKQQNLTKLDPVVIDREEEVFDSTEWRAAFGDELPQAGAAADDEGRVVTGTGIADLARAEVENPGESGYENAALALQPRARRRRLPVGLREDAVERRAKCEHGVADDLLGHRHQ